MKKISSIVISCLFVLTTILSGVPAQAKERGENTGKIYYVSSKSGSDSNDGLSKSHPFQSLDMINKITLRPGDQVLLENGSVFEDQFIHVKGSGNEQEPIKISNYGDDKERPQIHTNGKGVWYQDYGINLDNPKHKYKGDVSTSILLQDVEYIEISNLEITNEGADGNKKYNDLDVMDRTGVASFIKDKGTINHIVLDNLYIHDIIGNVYNKHMMNGGIYFGVAKATDEKATGIPKYDGVSIKNNHLDNVNRWGIAAAYTAYFDHFNGAAISDENAKTYGSSNVVIENNYIKDAGGDAITTMYCYRPLIQNNVSEGAARQINTKDYEKTSFGRVAAGIWPWKCKDSVFQFNECFDTKNGKNGNNDAQAWDADYGDGTIYQYNYSHGNTGGTVMFCMDESYRNTFRYNISQNDEKGIINAPSQKDAHIYNNTFFIKEGVSFIRPDMENGPMRVENNILFYSGDKPRKENWNPSGNKIYDNNLYYNVENLPADDHAINVAKDTKVLIDPGSAPATTLGTLNMHNNQAVASAFDGYKLAENSPAINAGKVINDANGYALGTDFFGYSIGVVPEVGAAESDVVSLALRSNKYTVVNKEISGLEKNTTVEKFLDNVIIDSQVTIHVLNKGGDQLSNTSIIQGESKVVLTYKGETVTYSFLLSSDNTIKSTFFIQRGNTLLVPSTDKNPITVGNILSSISIPDTASAYIYDHDGQRVLKGNVLKDMVIKVTAENGNVATYPIEIKNDYQWALDYVGNKQGNTWFAQMNNGDGTYTNLKDYDPTYPNWTVDTYFGVGIDAPSHSSIPTKDTHGLIMDTTGSSKKGGVAMSYRAPKSGNIAFSIKENEPYLRQKPNSGGSVILSLTVNGKVIQTSELSTSLEKADFANVDKISVNKGDYIRVEASNKGNPTKPSIHITPSIRYLDEENPIKDMEAPSKVIDLSVSDISKHSAFIQWTSATDNVDVNRYEIYNKGTLLASVDNGLMTTLRDLVPDTNYDLDVYAIDKAGNKSAPASISFKTLPQELYIVQYKFISGTQGMTLPQKVFDLLPKDESGKEQGTTVKPINLKENKIEVKKGTWIFKGWDKNEVVIDNQNASFVGTWIFKALSKPEHMSDAEKFIPIGKIQTIKRGEYADASKSIKNIKDLPEKTKFTWESPIDTLVISKQSATVLVKYPDASIDFVNVQVEIIEDLLGNKPQGTPNVPGVTNTSDKPSISNIPNTSDTTGISSLWVLLGLAGTILISIIFFQRRKQREHK